jgi:hypothetical protein
MHALRHVQPDPFPSSKLRKRAEELERQAGAEERQRQRVKQSPLPDMILKTPPSRTEIAKRLFHPDRDLKRRHEAWRKAMEHDPTRPSSDARTEACARGLVAFLPPPYPRMR